MTMAVLMVLLVTKCESSGDDWKQDDIIDHLGTILGTNWSKVLLKMQPANPILKKDQFIKGIAKIGAILYPRFMQTVKYQVTSFKVQNSDLGHKIDRFLEGYNLSKELRSKVADMTKWIGKNIKEKVEGKRRIRSVDDANVAQPLSQLLQALL